MRKRGHSTTPAKETAAATPAETLADCPADIPAGAAVDAGALLLEGDADAVAVGDCVPVGDADAVAVGDCVPVGDCVGVGGRATQAVLSAEFVSPSGHGVQKAAPLLEAKYPSGHDTHAAALDVPTYELNVPGLHVVHDVKESDHVPAGHGGPQNEDPGGVSVPASQGPAHDVLCRVEK